MCEDYKICSPGFMKESEIFYEIYLSMTQWICLRNESLDRKAPGENRLRLQQGCSSFRDLKQAWSRPAFNHTPATGLQRTRRLVFIIIVRVRMRKINGGPYQFSYAKFLTTVKGNLMIDLNKDPIILTKYINSPRSHCKVPSPKC